MWSNPELNRQEFEAIVRRPDAEIDLAAASLVVARHEHAFLDIGSYLRKLDQMAEEVRDLIGAERHPSTVIAGLVRYLFCELGFTGASDEYFDPRASYLNEVLDRRTGIPISLSIVYMEVARRAGFRVDGVGLPGHFIVKHPQPEGDVYVDPFNQGAVLTREDCVRKVHEIYSGNVEFQPFMLGAVTKRQILAREIHNLKTIYAAGRQRDRALAMVELLLTLAPWDLDEIRDRGMLRYHLGDAAGAVADLETYLQYSADAGDADTVRSSVRAIRKGLRGSSGISWA
jgi:regulator of sirC expression with transglutaminase-like and TPR domain